MTLTEPTKGTRAWERARDGVNAQLRAALKAGGITTGKKLRIAIQNAAGGRVDISDKAKQRLAERALAKE